MAIYLKSLLWLVSLGGIGYGLMLITEPSQDKLNKIRSTTSGTTLTEADQKKLLFIKRLKQEAQIDSKTADN